MLQTSTGSRRPFQAIATSAPVAVQLDADLRVLAQEAGHRDAVPSVGRQLQRRSASGASGSVDRDPPDPVLAERQCQPGELPAEPGRPGAPAARTTGAAARPPARRRPAPARSARPAPAAASAPGGRGAAARSPPRRRSARGSAARRAAPRPCPRRRTRGPASAGGAPGRRPSPGRRAGAASALASRWRTNRSDSVSATGGSMGSAERQPLRGAARPERLELLAARPGMEPLALLAEAGDERRPRQLGDLADPAQPEPGQAGPDVGVRREERRTAAGRGTRRRRRDPRIAGRRPRRVAGRDRGREPRPGDRPAAAAPGSPAVEGPHEPARRAPAPGPTAARGRRPGARSGRTPHPHGRSRRRARG